MTIQQYTYGILSTQAMGGRIPPPLIKDAVARHPYPLLLMSVSGSHLYGFASPDSDIDLRGVYALPVSELIGITRGPERIEKQDVGESGELIIDMVTYDLRKVATLLLGKNGNILEMIFSPLVVGSASDWHQELQTLAARTVTRYHEKHYRGFALGEWRALLRKGEREKHGVKHLLYLYRVLLTGIFLMRTGVVESCLPALLEMMPTEGVQELIDRKRLGSEQMPITEEELHIHQERYHSLLDTLDEVTCACDLPSEVSGTTRKALHDLVVRAHQQAG